MPVSAHFEELQQSKPAPFLYFNSWPGSGKHTIAKEIEKQLGGKARIVSLSIHLDSLIGILLVLSQIHNLQHIDLAGAILPRSSPQCQQIRSQLRQVVFGALATSSDTFKHLYVFISLRLILLYADGYTATSSRIFKPTTSLINRRSASMYKQLKIGAVSSFLWC
jgi:hypothetical protein